MLLVDDDVSLSRLFQYSLTKNGFECRTAMNGRDGYDLAASWLPDLIISDVMMPIMSGYEFRRKVLTDPAVASIPFVFLTAKSADDDLSEASDLGVADFIIKTAGPKILVDKVRAILGIES